MRWICLLVTALFLVGCDKEVKREPLQKYEIQKEVDCTHWGYCYIPIRGEWGLSSECDGHQSAKVRIQPYRSTYESGKTSVWEESEIVERYGTCQ